MTLPRLLSSLQGAARRPRALLAAAVLAGTLLGGGVASADSSVSIVDAPRPQPKWGYGPATVRVAPGSWVTWSNVGGDTHTVTAADGSFDSGPLDPGEGFSWYFDQPGRFAYVCSLHPWMKGTVVVGDAAGPAPTSDQISAPAPVGGMVQASSSASGLDDQAVSSDSPDSTDQTVVVADPAN